MCSVRSRCEIPKGQTCTSHDYPAAADQHVRLFSSCVEASPASSTLAAVAARSGVTAGSRAPRLRAAVRAAGPPPSCMRSVRGPRTAARLLAAHQVQVVPPPGEPRRRPRWRRSPRARADVRARPARSRRAGRMCARRRSRTSGGTRQHDVERPRRCVPLAGRWVRCMDSASTKTRGALLPRGIMACLALSLSV